MKVLHIVAAALAGLTSGVAAYHDDPPGPAADSFTQADINRDGRISWAEFQAYEAPRHGAGPDLQICFRRLDRNHQGSLTRADWQRRRRIQAVGSPPSAGSISSGA